MDKPIAYHIAVTTDWRLNIIITNKRREQLRSYSHFVTQEQAAQFADVLDRTVTMGRYTEFDACSFCGKTFFRHDKLLRVKDGRTLHQKCVGTAVRCGVLNFRDCVGAAFRCFPEDVPLFDYSSLASNSQSQSKDFRYAIQTVSKKTIHLFLIEPGGKITRHTCLTYEECLGLVQAIRERLEQLSNAALGTCVFCGRMTYIDKTNYRMASGELIHGSCMERFIQSPKSARVWFPAVRIPTKDVFGHRQLFGKTFDPSPFPRPSP